MEAEGDSQKLRLFDHPSSATFWSQSQGRPFKRDLLYISDVLNTKTHWIKHFSLLLEIAVYFKTIWRSTIKNYLIKNSK